MIDFVYKHFYFFILMNYLIKNTYVCIKYKVYTILFMHRTFF